MQVRMRSGTNATAASALRRGLGACAAAALAVGAWGCTPDTMGTGPVQAPALGASTASTGNSDLLLPGQYIVQFRDDISDAPGLARRLVSQHAGELGFTYTTVIKGFSAHLPPQAVEALRRNPQVKLVEPDVLVTTQTETQSNATWGLDRLDQRALPLNSSYSYAENGAGVKVYIVDTGIRYTHTEFGGRASFGFDAFGGNGSDCHGHGTHVAGTVGGAKYGVAKGVALVAVRVLDCNGSGSASGVIAGLDWIARNGPRPGVVNMSLGGSASSSLDDAVKRLFQAGIVTAVAAGNSNADACKYSPARAPEAMTIGASDSKDVRASFSNYGACVDWFAPGVGIVSAFHTSDVATAGASGTSMAAPHAAGAAALYLQRHPGATAQQVRDGLFAQTTKARISAAQSVNNHLLYALPDQDNSWTAPPPGPPVAGFTTFCADLACTLTDQSYGTSSLSTWSWDFGDGSTSRTQNPKHTYARPGKYTVKLTVLDNLGAASTATTELTATVITVTASVRKLKNSNQIDIRWSGATGSSVEIWKSFAVAATVPNTGAYTIANAGKGSLSGSVVRVCEVGSRVCSQWVVL